MGRERTTHTIVVNYVLFYVAWRKGNGLGSAWKTANANLLVRGRAALFELLRLAQTYIVSFARSHSVRRKLM